MPDFLISSSTRQKITTQEEKEMVKIRLTQNAWMSSEHARSVLEPFVCLYHMKEKKKK